MLLRVLLLWAVSLSAVSAQELVRRDGEVTTGQISFDVSRKLLTVTDSKLNIDQIELIRWKSPSPTQTQAPALNVIHLRHQQRLTGRIVRISDKAIFLDSPWAEKLELPRGMVERITHPEGWQPVATLLPVGKSKLTGQPVEHADRVTFTQPGQAIEVPLLRSIDRGRVLLDLDMEKSEGLAVTLLLDFGDRHEVRVELAGAANQVRAQSGSHIALLAGSKGRTSASITIEPRSVEIVVDSKSVTLPVAGRELRAVHLKSDGKVGGLVECRLLQVDQQVTPREPAPAMINDRDSIGTTGNGTIIGTIRPSTAPVVTVDTSRGEKPFGPADWKQITLRRTGVSTRELRGEHVLLHLLAEPGTTDVVNGTIQSWTDTEVMIEHSALGTLKAPIRSLVQVRPQFFGRLVEIEPTPQLLGDSTAFGLTDRKPVGLKLDRSAKSNLSMISTSVVVEVGAVAGTPITVHWNDALIGTIAVDRRSHDRIVRFAIPSDLPRREQNEISLRIAEGHADVRSIRLEQTEKR